MQTSATLIASASEASALNDTQVDEYYTDVIPDTLDVNNKEIVKNPYPGLRPFQKSESRFFFGRVGISYEILQNLVNSRFLAVLGSSGTGKSSIIRASLPEVLELFGEWKIVICRPGKNPFGNLARAIFSSKMISGSELEIWKLLSSSSYGYEQLYNAIDSSDQNNTLIVIDQFEELFRYRKDYGINARNDASLFVKMLIDASQNEKLNTYVLITMRSEYLGECVKFPQLADTINKGQYLVPRLKSKQLIDVITGPATINGASLDEGYASRLIGEIGDNVELPILQHVLRRAYQLASDRAQDKKNIHVTYNDYVIAGRIDGAINKHASEVYNGLTDTQKDYTKILFQSITDRATDGNGIRRPLSFVTILNICKEKAPKGADEIMVRNDLEIVINTFREDNVNFLMPPPHVPISDQLEIDITHESLMVLWTVLNEWINEEAKDAIVLQELLKEKKEEYIGGSSLTMYDEWQKRKNPKIYWATLYKSTDKKNEDYIQEFDDAISLINLSKRREKNSKLKLIGLIIFIVCSVLAAIFFYHQRNDQQEAYEVLTKFTDSLTKKQELITAKQVELKNTNDSLNQSKINLQKNNDTILKQKEKLDEEILKSQRSYLLLQKANDEIKKNLTTVEEQRENGIILNRQKDLLTDSLKLQTTSLTNAIAAGSKLQHYALAIKHAEKSLAIPIYDLKREDIKANLALLAYQLFLQSGNEEIEKMQPQVYAALYDALKRKAKSDSSYKDVWSVTSYKNTDMNHLSFAAITNSRDKHLAGYLTAEDNKIYSLDVDKGISNVDSSNTTGLNLVGITASTNGRWIAINTLSNKLLVIDENNQKKFAVALSGIVRTAKFSRDGQTLYAYTQDRVLTSIDLNGMKKSSQINSRHKLEEISISNKYIYGLTSTGDIIEWKRSGNGRIDSTGTVVISGQDKSIRGTVLNCTADDSIIVWGNERGQVFYKKIASLKEEYLTRFNGPITNIAFSDSSGWVAIASFDKTIQVFKLPNLQSVAPLKLDNNEGAVTALSFQKNSAGKDILVAVINPGLIRIYQMDLQTLACKLYGIYKGEPLNKDDSKTYIDNAVEDKKVAIKCQ